MTSPAVKKVYEDFRALSEEEREDFLVLQRNDDSEDVWVATPEQRADIAESMAAARAGKFVSLDEIKATLYR